MSKETKDHIIARLRDRITDLEAACLAATYIGDFEVVREMLQVAYGKRE